MPNLYRVRAVLTGVAGSPWYTNVHYDADGGGTAAAAAESVRLFFDGLRPSIRTPVLVTIDSDVPTIDVATGAVTAITSVNVPTVQCTSVADPLPTATQLLMRISTNTVAGGRRLRGRIAIPGLTEEANTGGVPLAATRTTVNGLFTSALSRPAGPVVMIYSKTYRVAGPATGANCWSQWSVLRSRRD